jgi:hypothetical protein
MFYQRPEERIFDFLASANVGDMAVAPIGVFLPDFGYV